MMEDVCIPETSAARRLSLQRGGRLMPRRQWKARGPECVLLCFVPQRKKFHRNGRQAHVRFTGNPLKVYRVHGAKHDLQKH